MTDIDFRHKLPDSTKTQRLTMRRPARVDLSAMTQLANNEKIYEMLARLPHPYTEEDGKHFIDTIARGDHEHAYSILTRDDGFIGVMGLHLLPERLPELGYWLGEPYWGEGYASEAAAALVKGAEMAGCKALRSCAKSINKASLRVLQKVGFVTVDEAVGDCGVHKNVAMTQLRWEADR